MCGVLLPMCSIFFSVLLCFAYFFKERFPLIENKVYSVMLIVSVVDSIIVAILQAIPLIYDVSFMKNFIVFLNKIVFLIADNGKKIIVHLFCKSSPN